jgi:hypothetical protein
MQNTQGLEVTEVTILPSVVPTAGTNSRIMVNLKE